MVVPSAHVLLADAKRLKQSNIRKARVARARLHNLDQQRFSHQQVDNGVSVPFWTEDGDLQLYGRYPRGERCAAHDEGGQAARSIEDVYRHHQRPRSKATSA